MSGTFVHGHHAATPVSPTAPEPDSLLRMKPFRSHGRRQLRRDPETVDGGGAVYLSPAQELRSLWPLTGPAPSHASCRKVEDEVTKPPDVDGGRTSREQWNEIIDGATREVWLHGICEYGYATDDDMPDIFARATARGCQVRVLLLNPDSPESVAIDRDVGYFPGVIAARTEAALTHFTAMRHRCGPRMQIRVCDKRPKVSVVRGDGIMLATPHMPFIFGSNSPTFKFHADETPMLFTRHTLLFESNWNNAQDWQPRPTRNLG